MLNNDGRAGLLRLHYDEAWREHMRFQARLRHGRARLVRVLKARGDSLPMPWNRIDWHGRAGL